jgi:hypothetical protein
MPRQDLGVVMGWVGSGILHNLKQLAGKIHNVHGR